MLTTSEVAAYLRLGERTVYELVRKGEIPFARITGKLLFPKQLVDLWVARRAEVSVPVLRPPPVVAGSHDPLLDWALRASGSDLATFNDGSLDGLRRLAEGGAVLAGIHILDSATGTYNVAAARAVAGLADLLLVTWAERQQGLVVAADNPLGLANFTDLVRRSARFVQRQEGAGAQTLFRHLLLLEGLAPDELELTRDRALTEADVAGAVSDGVADAGLAVEAVARRYRLGFVPLHRERFDLALRRRDYFEPPMQALMTFARGPRFRAEAESLGGYDVSRTGSVVYNA
jgi:excisionase family DNA binding protein